MLKTRPLIHTRRTPVLHLLLALSLLLAQVGAQAHGYSHLKAGQIRSDSSGSAGQLCNECLAASPLLSAAGSPSAPEIFFSAAITTPLAPVALAALQTYRYYAFRSRAPPDLL